MALWVAIHRIYEPEGAGLEYPVVEHRFYGRTRQEAVHYYEAHRTSDTFMRDCHDRGRWRQVNCVAAELEVRRLR
jgi:hypothetical protein